MNIVLIGYRGTGKTTIGKLLAKQLHFGFISTDDEIIRKAKIRIPEIVEKFGWNKFRDIEEEVIYEVSKLNNYVIDTGGGVILRNKNVENLKKNGKLILLTADVKTIVERIKFGTERPSLTHLSFIEEVEEVLKQRNEKYLNAKDFMLNTTNCTIEEIVEKIKKYINYIN